MSDIQYPIRVAQIMGKMCAGGVESVVFNYYRAIDKSKIQFDFFYDEDSTIEPPQDLIDMGAKFYKIPPYQKIWSYIPYLRKELKQRKYLIVHSHINTLSVFPLFSAFLSGVPIRIAHNHSVPGKGEFRRNTLKYILKIFAKIFSTDYFACSEKAGRWMFGNKYYDNGEVYVMHNAIDFNKFNNSYEREENEFLSQYDINGKFIVGHVGRFTYAKNHKYLINVFKYLKEKIPNAVLLLVGDGELQDLIFTEVERLKLQDSVIYTGKTDKPERYYSLMNVIILPSIFEGLSMVTIEAQVSKVPIVVSTAVPEEAVISQEGLAYMHLDASYCEWANKALELANKKVELTEKSNVYNILNAVKMLETWYLSKVI